MQVLLFGATGMVGQGVLDACLREAGVERVLALGRQRTGRNDPKLRELVQPDVTELAAHAGDLREVDACFFCLGVSSAGMGEERYTRMTHDLTLSVARQLVQLAPALTFVYVSGLGTDSTERGRSMWARVKGRTENALLALPFRAAYMFRPGLVAPGPRTKSRTRWYRVLYAVFGPVPPLLKRVFPKYVTATEEIGQAMLAVAREGYERRVLETRDIARAARKGGPAPLVA